MCPVSEGIVEDVCVCRGSVGILEDVVYVSRFRGHYGGCFVCVQFQRALLKMCVCPVLEGIVEDAVYVSSFRRHCGGCVCAQD